MKTHNVKFTSTEKYYLREGVVSEYRIPIEPFRQGWLEADTIHFWAVPAKEMKDGSLQLYYAPIESHNTVIHDSPYTCMTCKYKVGDVIGSDGYLMQVTGISFQRLKDISEHQIEMSGFQNINKPYNERSFIENWNKRYTERSKRDFEHNPLVWVLSLKYYTEKPKTRGDLVLDISVPGWVFGGADFSSVESEYSTPDKGRVYFNLDKQHMKKWHANLPEADTPEYESYMSSRVYGKGWTFQEAIDDCIKNAKLIKLP